MTAAMLALMLASPPAGRPAPARARVMILGTYHMANPGLDVVKTTIRSTSSPERQRELEALVERLGRWKPTRIALEVRPDEAATLEDHYRAYRAGRRALGASEVEQIGFRLARRLGLEQFCVADHGGRYPFDQVLRFVEEHGQPGARARLSGIFAQQGAAKAERDRRLTVAELLADINSEENLRWDHWAELAPIDAHLGAEAPGPALVAAWYERNLRIFANLRRCVDGPDTRLLVIYGAGHAPLLRQLVRDSPDLALDPVERYLPRAPPRREQPAARLGGLYHPAAPGAGPGAPGRQAGARDETKGTTP